MCIFLTLEEMRKVVGKEGCFSQVIVADRPFVMTFGITVCEIEIDRIRVVSNMFHLRIRKGGRKKNDDLLEEVRKHDERNEGDCESTRYDDKCCSNHPNLE